MSKEKQTLYNKLKGPGPDLSRYREGRQLEESEQRFLKAFFEKVRKQGGCFAYVFYFLIFVVAGGGGCMP